MRCSQCFLIINHTESLLSSPRNVFCLRVWVGIFKPLILFNCWRLLWPPTEANPQAGETFLLYSFIGAGDLKSAFVSEAGILCVERIFMMSKKKQVLKKITPVFLYKVLFY